MATGDFNTITGGTPTAMSNTPGTVDGIATANYTTRNGFDLVWLQQSLQTQMSSIEADIVSIEQNANLSDTEKMFSMQMSMNTWSAVSNLRTNMLKSVSDTLKTITRNVS